MNNYKDSRNKYIEINCSGNITKDEDINIKMNEVRIPVVAWWNL